AVTESGDADLCNTAAGYLAKLLLDPHSDAERYISITFSSCPSLIFIDLFFYPLPNYNYIKLMLFLLRQKYIERCISNLDISEVLHLLKTILCIFFHLQLALISYTTLFFFFFKFFISVESIPPQKTKKGRASVIEELVKNDNLLDTLFSSLVKYKTAA